MRLCISLTLLAMSVAGISHASTVIGNPNSGVIVVDGDDIYVHSIKAYPCAGGEDTIAIGVTLDELEDVAFQFDADAYCDVVVRLKWTPSSSLEPVAVTGFTELDISASGAPVEIELDKSAATAVLVQ